MGQAIDETKSCYEQFESEIRTGYVRKIGLEQICFYHTGLLQFRIGTHYNMGVELLGKKN